MKLQNIFNITASFFIIIAVGYFVIYYMNNTNEQIKVALLFISSFVLFAGAEYLRRHNI